jgi:lipopolysaccharide transport system ATP-binding protein
LPDTVIKVEGIGKKYRLGAKVHRYRTLRDTISSKAQAPVRLVRRVSGKGHVESKYPEFWALKDIDFEVERGDVLGIVGRNGSGKSTLLKILSRITEPTAGEARIRGRVASLLEVGTGFNPELSGRDNVYLNGAILGMKRAEIARKFDEIVSFAQVEEFIDTQVKKYSSGMYLRLAFAVAAHLEPEILVVDEVLAVGDAGFQRKCLGKMSEVARGGRTVLFVSHNLAAVNNLCSRAILLERGSMITTGTPAEVTNFYLSRERHVQSANDYPMVSQDHGVAINGVDVRMEDRADGMCLVVDIAVEALRPARILGVGMKITSLTGMLLAKLGPSATSFLVDNLSGQRICRLECSQIDRRLSGGDYNLGVWIAIPGVARLLEVEDAATISIPPRDIFGSGSGLVEGANGPIPLPLRFFVDGAYKGGPDA